MSNGIGSKIIGWVAIIGVLIVVNVLSRVFNWGWVFY